MSGFPKLHKKEVVLRRLNVCWEAWSVSEHSRRQVENIKRHKVSRTDENMVPRIGSLLK